MSPEGKCLHPYTTLGEIDVDEGIGAGESCYRVVLSKEVGYSSRMLSRLSPACLVLPFAMTGHESYGLGEPALIDLDDMASW